MCGWKWKKESREKGQASLSFFHLLDFHVRKSVEGTVLFFMSESLMKCPKVGWETFGLFSVREFYYMSESGSGDSRTFKVRESMKCPNVGPRVDEMSESGSGTLGHLKSESRRMGDYYMLPGGTI